tara:strand:- start:3600 stop:4157 length:558 start_codon:yes stop_codon:yes gene_type:complete
MKGKSGGRADMLEMVSGWHPGQQRLRLDDPRLGFLDRPFLKNISRAERENLPYMETSVGTKFSIHYHGHMFCASSCVKEEIFQRMFQDFGADMYYHIYDFKMFMLKLASSRRELRDVEIGNVIYDKEEWESDSSNDLFRKTKCYEWQQELRGVWRNLPPGPFITTAEQAFRFVAGIHKNPAALAS